MKTASRKVADVKGKDNTLYDELRRDILEPYVSIQPNVVQTLLAVGSHLRELIKRDSERSQQSVRAALCNAADSV